VTDGGERKLGLFRKSPSEGGPEKRVLVFLLVRRSLWRDILEGTRDS
jgi:hypothetical protein